MRAPLVIVALSAGLITYECEPGPPIDPPGGGGGGGGSGDPPDPGHEEGRDADDDGEIACLYLTVETNNPSSALENRDRLGSNDGGLNTDNPCHTGVAIQCNEGDPVYASHSGTVTKSGPQANDPDSGNMVSIISGDKYYDALHLKDVVVGVHQYVKAGDLIGHCGHTGTTTGVPHLHLRVTQHGNPNSGCPKNGNMEMEDPEVKFPCS